eukprot:gene33566-44951_t
MICKALAATKEFHCEQAGDGSKAVDMVRPHLLHSSLDVNLTIGDDFNTFARGAEEAINNVPRGAQKAIIHEEVKET